MSLNDELLINFEDLPEVRSNPTIWDIENNEKIQFIEYINNNISNKFEDINLKIDERVTETINNKLLEMKKEVQEVKKENEKKTKQKIQEVKHETENTIAELKNEILSLHNENKEFKTKILEITSKNDQINAELKNENLVLRNSIKELNTKIEKYTEKKNDNGFLESIILDLTLKGQINAEKYSPILLNHEIEIEYIDYSFVSKELEDTYNCEKKLMARGEYMKLRPIIVDKYIRNVPVKKMFLKINELTNLDFSDIILRDHQIGVNHNLAHFVKTVKRRSEYYQIDNLNTENQRLIVWRNAENYENEIKKKYSNISMEIIPRY